MDFAALLAVADRATLQHLGSTVHYMPRVGTAVGQTLDVRGIFDAAYVRSQVGDAEVESARPAVFFRLADLPGDPGEDDPVITVGGVEYTARETQPDGQGGVVVLLREA